MIISKRTLLLIALSIYAIVATKSCSENARQTKIAHGNINVIMDTVRTLRTINGKTYAENASLRLTADELRAYNGKLSKDLYDVTKRLKRALARVQVSIVHDTLIVPVIPDTDGSFDYADSCLYASYKDSTFTYSIAPSKIDIIQYRRGDEVIAAVNVDGCGQVSGISSLYIEQKKTPWWKKPLLWFATGFFTARAI